MKQIIFLSLFVLLIPSAMAIPYQYEISLKQQIEKLKNVSKVIRTMGAYDMIVEIEGTNQDVKEVLQKIRKQTYLKSTMTIVTNDTN